MQSTNEELQSTNEELETSKEELQSVNEELVTVNSELEQKINELPRTGNDMKNLLTSTEIGTIFLDTHLNVQWFTPATTNFIKLIPTDIVIGKRTMLLNARRLKSETDSDSRRILLAIEDITGSETC